MASEEENMVEFAKIGEAEVRRKYALDAYQGTNKKHADIWLDQLERERDRINKNIANITTIILAITASMGAILTIISMCRK